MQQKWSTVLHIKCKLLPGVLLVCIGGWGSDMPKVMEPVLHETNTHFEQEFFYDSSSVIIAHLWVPIVSTPNWTSALTMSPIVGSLSSSISSSSNTSLLRIQKLCNIAVTAMMRHAFTGDLQLINLSLLKHPFHLPIALSDTMRTQDKLWLKERCPCVSAPVSRYGFNK